MKDVLVTGATGVLGSALIPLYLDEPDTVLRLLVRAGSAQHLNERVDKLLGFWGPRYNDAPYRNRVIPLRGDVTLPNLGLAAADYQSITAEVTHIVHAAANVNMKMTEAEAKRISVDSTCEVLQLAEQARQSGQLEKLDYVSTLGIAGKRRGRIPEVDDLGPRAFNTTYESSKAEAEEHVLAKMKDGLPITIHRPSMIVGASEDGKIRQFQIFYYICEFLTGKYTSGFLPDTGDTRIDTVPVDFVARVLKWSSGTSLTTGRILHVCAGHEYAVSAKEVAERVRTMWFDACSRPVVRRIPLPVFRCFVSAVLLCRGDRGTKSLQNLKLLLDHLDVNQRFENSATLELLQAGGIKPPAVDSYLPNVLHYYLNHRKTQ